MQSVLEAFTNREICGPCRSAVDQDQGQLKVALTSVVAVRKRRPNQRCTERGGVSARCPHPPILKPTTVLSSDIGPIRWVLSKLLTLSSVLSANVTTTLIPLHLLLGNVTITPISSCLLLGNVPKLLSNCPHP